MAENGQIHKARSSTSTQLTAGALNKKNPHFINLGCGNFIMNKKHKINLHKFYVLMQLLQDDLDDFEHFEKATPRMKQLRADLSEFCELLNNECNGTFAVQKSTYFQELSNKIDTMMRKCFNPDM